MGIADGVIGLGYLAAPPPITPDGPFAPPTPPSTPISRWFDLRIVGADRLDEHAWTNELFEPELGRTHAAPDLRMRRLSASCGTLSMEGGELMLTPTDPLQSVHDAPRPISLAVRPRVATFISDHHVVVGSIDGSIDVVHLAADGRSVLHRHTMTTDIGLVDAAADGDWLVAACDDQVTRLWFLPTLTAHGGDDDHDGDGVIEPSVQLVVGEDDEWVVWTPSGFYASSPCGDQHLSYVLDRGATQSALTFGCDRFLSSFHRPGLVELTLQLGSERAAMQSLRIDAPTMADLLPPVVERLRVLDVGTADALISFDVASVGGPPPTSVIVLVDGVPFWESGPGQPVEYIVIEEAVVQASDAVRPETSWARVVTQQLSTTIDIDTVAAIDQTSPEGTAQRLVLRDSDGGERWRAEIHPGVRAQLRVSTSVDDRGRSGTVEAHGVWQVVGSAASGDDPADTSRSPRFAPIPPTTPLGGTIVTDNAPVTFEFDDDDPAPPTRVDSDLPRAGARGGTEDDRGADDAALSTGDQPDRSGDSSTADALANAHDALSGATTPDGEAGALTSGAGTQRRRGQPSHEPGQLFMVSVGVSDLDRDGAMLADLRFAADDAREIANRLSASRSAAFGSVWRRVITERQATSAGLRATLDELVEAVNRRVDDKRARNVRAHDVVVFFFAGHGITHRADGDERDLFRVVTHDFDEQDIVNTTVPVSVIGGALAKLPMQVVVLIDACRSGAALPGRWRRSTPGELSKELLAVPDRVMYVISATTSTESAWEHTMRVPYHRTGHSRPLVGHGLFTHAILKQMDDAGASLSLLELVAGIQRQLIDWTDRDGWRHIRQRPKAQIDGEIPHLEVFRSLTAD